MKLCEPQRKQVQADLIDKFIIANPRIEPVRDKTDKPVEDISQPFTEEKGEFVTETLARIYINQGYYSKAIDIYEKLSLKYPEKSSYFATQIEKVKELNKISEQMGIYIFVSVLIIVACFLQILDCTCSEFKRRRTCC